MANGRWATAEDRCGRNLRRLREERGLSQAELAHKMEEFGVSLHPSAIAKIEARDVANPRTIRLNEADALARALGVQLWDLLAGPHQEFLSAATLLEQAVFQAESANRWIDGANAKLAALSDITLEDIDPDDVEAFRQTQDKINDHLKRLEQIRGEHQEKG